MSDLVFRRAMVSDLPFIVGLIHHDSAVTSIEEPENANAPAYEQAFRAIDADPAQMLIVVEKDGEAAGTLQLTFTPGIALRGALRCTIEAVHVAPACRNAGVGGAMIRWALETARERGCTRAQLTSNKLRTDAHRFYLRLGFVDSHEGFKLRL